MIMKFRAFIGVELSINEILQFREEIEKVNANLKLVEPENIHMTLKFLGNIEESIVEDIAKIMKESVSEISPFTLKFKNVGAFPNLNFIKVIWVGIENPELLTKIAKNLDNGLSLLYFKKEKRGFSPHITLARVRGPKKKDELKNLLEKNLNRDFGDMRVDGITLKKSVLSSKGPKYYTIKEVDL